MPKKLPVVAVDFDDMLNNFHEFVVMYVSRHGITATYESLVSYDFTVDLGITSQQNEEWMFDIVENHHDQLLPDTVLISMLTSLKEHARFELVTSRCEEMSTVTLEWLEMHAPGLFYNAHFLNGMATRFPERRRRKVDVCREIGAVAMFEDAPHHATELALGLNIPVYLPTRPWNTRVRQGVSRSIIPVADKVAGWNGVGIHLRRILGMA